MRSGRAYGHRTLGLRTDASGCSSLLPTPNAGNFNDGEDLASWERRRAEQQAKHRNGNGMGTPLSIAVQMLPTPTVNDSRGGRNRTAERSNPHSTHHDGVTLVDAVSLLPTPTAMDCKGANTRLTHRGGNPTLLGAVRGVPTNPPSDDGSTSSDGQLPLRLTNEDD